jgi:hypothetical protein
MPKQVVCPVCKTTFVTYYGKSCSYACNGVLNGLRQARLARSRRKKIRIPAPVAGARWIPLTKGKCVLVDADVFDELSPYNWYLNNHGDGYAARRTRDGIVYLHRVVVRAGPSEQVDHRDLNTLDCRRQNLRIATDQQNNANRRKHAGPNRETSSKYKGVNQPADYNKWIACITVNDKTLRVGTFKKEIDAARAYDAAARKYFGEFAFLNFPGDPSC